MRNLINFTLNAGILLILSLVEPSFSQNLNIKELSQKLESSFNSNDISQLNNLIDSQITLDIQKRFLAFRKEFPNAKWKINPAKQLKGERQSIDLLITAEKKIGSQIYSLEASQKIAIEISKGKIINREVLSESSILKTKNKPINITIQIPDLALTGSWYDIDIIINKPLENSIIAGGLAPLTNKEKNILSKNIELKPMGSGGIFKSVQAPLSPGKQRWAAIIAHPEGIISITKLVRIVSTEEELNLQ